MGIDAQMLVKTRQQMSEKRVRRLSVDLVEAFGQDAFSIMLPGEWDDLPNGRHALERIEVYEQDGDDIRPERGESLLEVYLSGRYYGKGYERGPIWLHIAIASWLECRIRDARIFYGGDSSGVCAQPFGPQERDRLFEHFAMRGHRPYTGAFGWLFTKALQPVCGFCDYAMTNCGGGQGVEFYRCDGCGAKVIRRGEEITRVERGKDFFDYRK